MTENSQTKVLLILVALVAALSKSDCSGMSVELDAPANSHKSTPDGGPVPVATAMT
jgi:hypothetical protein